MLQLLFTLALSVARAQDNGCKLLDAKILARPLVKNDKLQVLKELWQQGARGEFFMVTDDATCYGFYSNVKNWDQVQPRESNFAIFLRDKDLLATIQATARTGTQIAVHSRVPNGGFTLNTDNNFFKTVAAEVPSLSQRPWLVINGYTHRYLFNHELSHQSDNSSGFADKVWLEIKTLPYPEMQLEPVYYYIAEARAYLHERESLQRSITPLELSGTEKSLEFTEIEVLKGQKARSKRRLDIEKSFNEDYARAIADMPKDLRMAAQIYFLKYIPNFTTDFDSEYRMRPRLLQSSCNTLLTGPKNSP